MQLAAWAPALGGRHRNSSTLGTTTQPHKNHHRRLMHERLLHRRHHLRGLHLLHNTTRHQHHLNKNLHHRHYHLQ